MIICTNLKYFEKITPQLNYNFRFRKYFTFTIFKIIIQWIFKIQEVVNRYDIISAKNDV